MFISGKKLCILLTAIGSVLADAKNECNFLNTLLGQEESYDCCSLGYPYIKCNKDHITYINLNDMTVTKSEFPASFGDLSQLTVLNISNKGIKGSLPSDFENLGSLVELNLSGNEISGEIPSNISKLTNLKTLNLSKNKITSFPKEITELPLLTDLILNENSIEGNIIEEVKNFKNLRVLDLGSNNLNGTIPDAIVQIKDLVKLNLSNNKLEGEIPKAIGDLSSLKYLILNKNNLSGEIPSSIEKLIMTEIDVSDNTLLYGKVPDLSYTTVNHVCKYKNTELCFKKDSKDSKCEYENYECSNCVSNAQKDSNGICRCKENFTGIGYDSCSSISDLDDNGLNNEKDAANFRSSFQSLTIASIIIIATYLLYLM